jgi:upstream activation factor subunit UAF30
MARFDKFNSERNGVPEPAEPIPTVEKGTTNGTKHSHPDTSEEGSGTTSQKHSPGDESDLSELEDAAPPKKKHKKQRSVEDDDAKLAAKLQAELNAESRRARSTRGGNTKKRAPAPKKKTKKKSANRVKDEDDSDIGSGSGAEKREVKRTGGFHVCSFISPSSNSQIANVCSQKPMALSPPLSELLGETQLSRPQTVKKIWEYVKERDLQDPNDKRQIRCDDAMRAVFKQDRVHMFTMNKILNQNLYALDE